MGDTWAPRAGAYGRTRDGQRVGPLHHGTGNRRFWILGRSAERDPEWTEEGRMAIPGPEGFGDLVAEWSDGPVRTVTRHEIVPGTYGLVTVGRVVNVPDCENPDTPAIVEVNVELAAMYFSADELDAAARVLTELAGALRG